MRAEIDLERWKTASMYLPAQHDERTNLAEYVDQQLAAIRASLYGLTEEQARETPCRSALSLAGIVKHTTHGMRGGAARLRGEEPSADFGADATAAYMGSFVLSGDETAVSVRDEFDAARREYLAAFRTADPDAEAMEPPSPWFGIFESRPIRLRYYMTHQVEEMARHAGHADIIREQLDGMAIPSLVMTLEGAPANRFFQPFQPPPGTIGR